MTDDAPREVPKRKYPAPDPDNVQTARLAQIAEWEKAGLADRDSPTAAKINIPTKSIPHDTFRDLNLCTKPPALD